MELFNKSGKLHPNLIIIISSMWHNTWVECLLITNGVADLGTRVYEVQTLKKFNLNYKILDRR